MKKLLTLVLFMLAALPIVLSCKDENSPTNGEPQFSIDEQYLNIDFEQKASSTTIPVKTNLETDKWSVTSDAEWCLVDQKTSSSSAEVLISVLENKETDIRTATVSVQSQVANYTIQVRQLGEAPAILVKDAQPKIKAKGGKLDITVTSNIEYTTVLNEGCDWIAESRSRTMTEKTYGYNVEKNNSFDSRTAVFTYTGKGGNEKVQAVCTVTQEGEGMEGVIVEGDIKVTPSSATADQTQPGCGIEFTYDGKTDPTNHYHSPWGHPYGEETILPVTMEYIFDDKPDMDYAIYYPRNGNGNFGKVEIYIATEEKPEYEKVGDHDFLQASAPGKVKFGKTYQKVTKVKFVVNSGLGGFASCAEMEFYKVNTEKKLDRQLLAVFKDLTCTELKDNVTDEVINALPAYFVNLATMLRNNTYDPWEKEFRIQEYKPYSNVEEWAERLMTKRYSSLDNPTGICVEEGDSLVILVGETHGHEIAVRSIWEEETGFLEEKTYVQTAASGETQFLQQGVNKIGFKQKGMLFIIYTASPSEQPITVHIAPGSGQVQGYFDLEKHKTNEKYKEFINKSTFKYFCVKGERIMFYFHREEMKRAVPEDILSAIGLWDDIIKWQQELMGIEDVRPSQVNNHLFAISPEGSYMWASDYRIAFVYTYLNNILLKENVMAAKDNAWGPAHEIGHIHQRAIDWPGSTESSNNLFSNYILYKLGKYCSRGEELDALATARFVNKQAWYNMGSATHQGEDTELHMRMNWQLWNYYHRCGHNPKFWQTLFKLMREGRININNPGEGQLKFAVNACKAANQNLEDFFRMWGFFEPVDNKPIEQYGNYTYNVTQNMIDNALTEMRKLPNAKHAFYYLEDRKAGDEGIGDYNVGNVGYYTQFEKEGTKITKPVKYSKSGNQIRITDGDEAVAFEIRANNNGAKEVGAEGLGELLYFSNFYNFTIPPSISTDNIKVYAVQADGKRKECSVN